MNGCKGKDGRLSDHPRRWKWATALTDHEPHNPLQSAERDVIALGIAAAAIIMLVGTGSSVLPQTMLALLGQGRGPDVVFVNALLLNICLLYTSPSPRDS